MCPQVCLQSWPKSLSKEERQAPALGLPATLPLAVHFRNTCWWKLLGPDSSAVAPRLGS